MLKPILCQCHRQTNTSDFGTCFFSVLESRIGISLCSPWNLQSSDEWEPWWTGVSGQTFLSSHCTANETLFSIAAQSACREECQDCSCHTISMLFNVKSFQEIGSTRKSDGWPFLTQSDNTVDFIWSTGPQPPWSKTAVTLIYTIVTNRCETELLLLLLKPGPTQLVVADSQA